jgi:hypothetical protein
MNAIKTRHNLDFESCEYHLQLDPNKFWMNFRVGTCEGLWTFTKDSYDILSIINNNPGNGHLIDVFQWFENSCKRDKKNLRVLELLNKRFKKYLIDKRGFKILDKDNLIKLYENMK